MKKTISYSHYFCKTIIAVLLSLILLYPTAAKFLHHHDASRQADKIINTVAITLPAAHCNICDFEYSIFNNQSLPDAGLIAIPEIYVFNQRATSVYVRNSLLDISLRAPPSDC